MHLLYLRPSTTFGCARGPHTRMRASVCLLAAAAGASTSSVLPRADALSRHRLAGAPNVWKLPLPEPSLSAACAVFDELLPYLEDGLIEELQAEPVPCRAVETRHGRYFVMRAGSSTNEQLRDSSDLAWISVDDRTAWDTFANIFDASGVAEALAPLVDLEAGVRLYSSFFVVRSRCSAPNMHTDWPDAVETNAFTLLAPLDDYATSDFHLLFHGSTEEGGRSELQRYTYRRGEALTFASRFVHSTEPGAALNGHREPHAFLCFTFGSDKAEHWSDIRPVIGGYQSRFLCRYDGEFELTDLGKYLRDEEEAEAGRESDSAEKVDVFA